MRKKGKENIKKQGKEKKWERMEIKLRKSLGRKGRRKEERLKYMCNKIE